MIEFSIILVTYNRHELLQYTLKSLSLQTYKNFKVILIDNGSDPPVDPSNFPSELDISLVRYNNNEHGSDVGNEALQRVEGTHFGVLADDDVWTPRTLEITAGIFQDNKDVKSLGVGFSRYDLALNRPLNDQQYFRDFSGRLERFDAFNAAISYCSYWGIGPKVNYLSPRMAHPSASFFEMEMARKTIEKQGVLFVKPLFDVGYVGCCFYQKNINYLDVPLVVLGDGHARGLDSSLPGQRMKLMKEVPFLEFSPLQGCTFVNMAVESHLKVLNKNGINKLRDCTLRSDFYLRHLEQIASDSPWTETTERDIEETLPFAAAALQRENNFSHGIAGTERAFRNWIEEKRKASRSSNAMQFH